MLKKYLPFLLLLILIIPTFIKLIRPGYFPMHDDMQAMRLLQMDQCVADGQIPCRWVPDMGFGYGYPQFNYYSPLPYYIMEVVHLAGLGFLDSVKAGMILSVVVSAIGMYLLGNSLWGKAGGFTAALFYAYAPYRSVDLWVRGAMGELWAFAFLPFIFWSVKKVFDKDKKAILWMALSIAALLMSHNITSLIFIPFVILWILFLALKDGHSPVPYLKRNYKKFLIGFFWAFSISAFFVLPAWFERNLVQVETLTGGFFDYSLHFVSIGQLLFSTYWNWGSSELGNFDEIYLGVGILHWITPILVAITLFTLKKKKQLKTVLFFVVLGWASLFMTHTKSRFIWDNISIFRFFQFPWRFLLLSSFFFSAAAGAIAVALNKKSARVTAVAITLGLLLLFYASYFVPSGWIDINDKEKFSGENWSKQQTISIYDYLPKTVVEPPAEAAKPEPEIISGEAKLANIEKGSNWYKVETEVLSDNVLIKLPVYYFPNWKVEVNGEDSTFSYNNDQGLISLQLPKGKHDVYAKLFDTPIRQTSNLISVLALVAIPVYLKRNKIEK